MCIKNDSFSNFVQSTHHIERVEKTATLLLERDSQFTVLPLVAEVSSFILYQCTDFLFVCNFSHLFVLLTWKAYIFLLLNLSLILKGSWK